MTQTEMIDLWISFAEIYGHKWTSSFGTSPSNSWVSGLSGVTVADVRFGISVVINSGSDWPPSLPEFIGMCFEINEKIVIKRIWSDFGDNFRKSRMTYSQVEKIEKDRFLQTKSKILEESKEKSRILEISRNPSLYLSA